MSLCSVFPDWTQVGGGTRARMRALPSYNGCYGKSIFAECVFTVITFVLI